MTGSIRVDIYKNCKAFYTEKAKKYEKKWTNVSTWRNSGFGEHAYLRVSLFLNWNNKFSLELYTLHSSILKLY